MPEIIESFSFDEKYTIVSELSEEVKSNNEFLKGALIGRVAAPQTRVITQTKIVKVRQPILTGVSDLLRNEGKKSTSVGNLSPQEIIIRDAAKRSNVKVNNDSYIKKLERENRDLIKRHGESIDDAYRRGRISLTSPGTPLKPDYSVETFSKKERISLTSPGMPLVPDDSTSNSELTKKKKKVLGVGSAHVFSTKKELKQRINYNAQNTQFKKDIHTSLMKLDAAEVETIKVKQGMSTLNSTLAASKKELKALKTSINRDYVTKAYHLKQITRLQMTLQKYAHMATGISAYQGEFVTGGDAGEITRERRQQQKKAMEGIAETRRQSTLGNVFNKMGMKARRA